MLPTINGKSLLECTLEDLKVIIDNPDYRENDGIDYKRVFTINYIPKEEAAERQDKIEEFRNDVCAFANASGGYLIFGIDEDGNGIPHELCGTNITEDNIDKFELDIKNYLQVIQPKIPHYKLNTLRLENGKYLVVMFIQHDMFVPYLHISNEKNYLIYKRTGNSKTTVSYLELKTMFTNSFNIERQIKDFRNKRIEQFIADAKVDVSELSRFMLLHIIPETYLDSTYDKPMYILENKGEPFKNVFAHTINGAISRPIIEGLQFESYYSSNKGRIYNNGTLEAHYILKDDITNNCSEEWFLTKEVFSKIYDIYYAYFDIVGTILNTQHFYACISIVGCNGVILKKIDLMQFALKIDRDILACPPVLIDSATRESLDISLKKLKIQYYLSLGAKDDKELEKAIAEVYKR